MIEEMPSLYDQEWTVQPLDGSDPVDLAMFKGKKLLVVNVASKCGFTKQYADLQTLHDEHGDQVAIIGFPSNDFGGQEPGTAEEIAQFCQVNYGVTFPLFAKSSVKTGDDQHPLFAWLSTKEKNGWNEQAPTWNFCKYLVNERGELQTFFASAVRPTGPEMLDAIGQ